MAVLRSCCSDTQRDDRRARQEPASALADQSLLIDGYNVLISLEAALARGVLILGRDGCLRDLASFHGHFRRVEETESALVLLGSALAAWRVSRAVIYLDKPVSNSGRLATTMRAIADDHGWPWTVQLVPSPDAVLRDSDQIIASADSAVLDAGGPWFNLAREIVSNDVPDAEWVDLTGASNADEPK